jgi:hypothetical protein
MSRIPHFSRSAVMSYAGLLIGVVGLIIQWIADPSKFDEGSVPVPPGILFILAFGVLMLLTSRCWWHPVFAVLIAFWIVVMGSVADKLQPNLTSHNAGTVVGNVVMALGLVFAGVAGVSAMVSGRRTQRRRVA